MTEIKKTYHAPTLTIYGSVEQITQSKKPPRGKQAGPADGRGGRVGKRAGSRDGMSGRTTAWS